MKNKTLPFAKAVRAALLVLLLSVAGLTQVKAQSFTVDNLNYSINEGGATVALTGHADGTAATGELVIPESVVYYGTSYAVTSIANNAFYNCSGLTGSLVIPNSILTIGESAFWYCSGMTGSLTLPEDVTSIGHAAFFGCKFTGALTIPESVTWIGRAAFDQCDFTVLNYNAINCSLHAQNSYYYSGYRYASFDNMPLITQLNIGEKVQVIPARAFRYLTGLACELVIPNTVNNIGWEAFYNRSGLTGTLVLPDGVMSIGDRAFYGCNGLTGTLTIPRHVTTIGEDAFGNTVFSALHYNADNCTNLNVTWLSNVTSLTSLSIGDFVQRIPDNFLSNFSSIIGELTIPNAVTYIGTNAFAACTGFSGTLTLGSSLVEIGNSAFFDACGNITSIYSFGETPPTLGTNVFTSVNTEIPVYVSCGSLDAYQGASGWDIFTNLQETNPCQWGIMVAVLPANSGSVSGTGIYEQGATCTLTATANTNYVFVNWTEDGVEVSTDEEYVFEVTGHRNLVANFRDINIISIGNVGDSTNKYLPSYSYYKQSLTQQIYAADEIGRAGVIKNIAFYNGGATKSRYYDVYLVHTDKAAFDNVSDWVAVTESDKVFDGYVTMYENDWTTISFNTPFAYNGVSNLVLVVDDNTGSYTNAPHMACRVFETNGNQTLHIFSDDTNYNPFNPT